MCYALLAAAPALASGPVPSAEIQRITLERDCFSCARGSRLSLLRNGTACLTLTGKARHGTVDQRACARLAPADFQAMAALLQELGFFALDALYDDPEQRDGAWQQWRIEVGEDVKDVFAREGSMPEPLARLEAAMRALQSRLDFNPEP